MESKEAPEILKVKVKRKDKKKTAASKLDFLAGKALTRGDRETAKTIDWYKNDIVRLAFEPKKEEKRKERLGDLIELTKHGGLSVSQLRVFFRAVGGDQAVLGEVEAYLKERDKYHQLD